MSYGVSAFDDIIKLITPGSRTILTERAVPQSVDPYLRKFFLDFLRALKCHSTDVLLGHPHGYRIAFDRIPLGSN